MFLYASLKKILFYGLIPVLALMPELVLSQPGNKLPIGNFELSIGARPAVPYPALNNYNRELTASGVGDRYTVQVSRHHIIPFNVLRAFYNRLTDQNALRNARGFFTQYSRNLINYAGANGIDCTHTGNDLVDAGNLTVAQGYGMARGGESIMAPGFDTFEQFYVWLPGNLFTGPNNRSDDPHDEFESNASVVVGEENFNILSRAYGNMIRYNNGDNSVLNSVVADLTRVASRRAVYDLKSENWELVNGKYRLKKPVIFRTTLLIKMK